MILDQTNLFSDAQVVTATAASENVIDLGATGVPQPVPQGAPSVALKRDIGKGTPIDLLVQLVADTTGTPGTLTVELQVDDNEGFASAKTVESSVMQGTDAGSRINMRYLPVGVDERYFRLNYVEAGGTTPSYTVTAGLVMAIGNND